MPKTFLANISGGTLLVLPNSFMLIFFYFTGPVLLDFSGETFMSELEPRLLSSAAKTSPSSNKLFLFYFLPYVGCFYLKYIVTA
jgi:hypothetical protein